MKHNLFLGVQPAPYRVDLCNWLYEQLDCDIYHLTPTGEDLAFDQAALKSSFRFDYKIYPKGSLPFLASLVKSHRPEVVFVSEFSMTALWMCLLKRMYRTSFRVVSICDDSMDMILGNDFSKRHTYARRYMPRLLDNLVLDNPETAAWYQNRFGKGVCFPIVSDERRLRAELEDALPLSRELVRQHGLAGFPVLLYVGRLMPLKQVDLLLRAFAPLKEKARLVIVGDGESMESLQALDDSLGTGALFTGRKSGQELMAWYNVGGIHLLPSRQEAFGAVTGEALTAGLYSLVSERAVSSSLIRPGNGRVLAADDPSAWTAAIRDFLPLVDTEIHLRDSKLPVCFETLAGQVFRSL